MGIHSHHAALIPRYGIVLESGLVVVNVARDKGGRKGVVV